MPIEIELYLFGFVTVTLLFFLGRLLSVFTKEDSDFKSMALVVIVLTTLFALLVSSSNSYLLILLVFTIYACFRDRSFSLKKAPVSIKVFTKESYKNWLIQLGYFTFSFFLLNLELLFGDSLYANIHPDFSFYAGVSEILVKTGIENRLFDYALAGERSFSFYHYFELWYNGAMSSLFSISSLNALMYITIPFFSTLMLQGVKELQQKLFDRHRQDFSLVTLGLPLLILFVFPYTISFRWLISFGNNFEPWNPSIALNVSLKWMIVLSGFLFLLLDYKKNKLKNIVFILGFLSVIYPTTMIATIPSLLIWSILYRKVLPKRVLWDVLIIVATVILVMWRVGSFNTSLPSVEGVEIPSVLVLIDQYFLENPKQLLLFAKEPLLRTGYILVAFTPLLVLLAFQYKELLKKLIAHQKIVILLFIMYLLSIGGVVLLDFSYDGDQLHRNIFYPFYILTFFLGCLYIIKTTYWIKYLGIFVLGFTTILNLVGITDKVDKSQVSLTELNQKSVQQIKEAFSKDPGEAVFIADTSYFHNTRKMNFYFIVPGHNLRFDLAGYYPYCLSLDRIKLNNEGDWFNLGGILLSAKYYEEVINLEKTYREILDEHEIKYVIIDMNSPEYKDAESYFGVEFIGAIDNFSYFRRTE